MVRPHHQSLRAPTPGELRDLAATHEMELSDQEVEAFINLIDGTLDTYERIGSIPEPRREQRHTTREPGYRPDTDEDPNNAFVTRCYVKGADDGPLSGYDIGVKDNIAVRGVEMTCGSNVFDGYLPARDATAVRRLLDAGGDIVGKTNMSDMAVSGTGELSATGPVLNPRNSEYLAGGSSSGSAAAVVEGSVDIALSTDQAGSIRVPAAWSGCVGHKPTHGLVPYTGALGMGYTFDHIGPITNSVADAALALDVLAGYDSDDPRQKYVQTHDYANSLTSEPDDITVGVIEEGFVGEQPSLDETVRDACDAFAAQGATVETVSIPWHEEGTLIWRGIVPESIAALHRDEGVGHYVDGFYDTQFLEQFANAKRARANDFPPTYKFLVLLGQYLAEEHHSRFYAKAQNLLDELTDAYDSALADVDVLALPTSPTTAYELGEPLHRSDEIIERAQTGVRTKNSSPFDVTGHPAVSVPCGTDDGLPVGLMFVGEHFDDATVLRAAQAFEQSVDVDLDG
ncbi:amidase (plasmid) [Natronosalvus halobius]|nr:amidase [Natronosalvus halobius]